MTRHAAHHLGFWAASIVLALDEIESLASR